MKQHGDPAAEVVAVVRRDCDGKPLPKQREMRDEPFRTNAMEIENLIIQPGVVETTGKAKPKKQRRKKKSKGASGVTALAGRVEQYDVVARIAQASAGISIGQLLRKDLKNAV